MFIFLQYPVRTQCLQCCGPNGFDQVCNVRLRQVGMNRYVKEFAMAFLAFGHGRLWFERGVIAGSFMYPVVVSTPRFVQRRHECIAVRMVHHKTHVNGFVAFRIAGNIQSRNVSSPASSARPFLLRAPLRDSMRSNCFRPTAAWTARLALRHDNSGTASYVRSSSPNRS